MRGRETRKREQNREQKPSREGQQERMQSIVDKLVRALLPQRQQGQQERNK